MELYTKTQQAMLAILADGRPHTREELHACCGPSSRSVIQFHISTIRRKLAAKGEDIVCVRRGHSLFYQHVRLLVSPYGPNA